MKKIFEKYFKQGMLYTLLFMLLIFNSAFAEEYKLCTGREFNTRVKEFLNWRTHSPIEDTITKFERGYNPPSNPEYFVDVSENKDRSVIVYKQENDINARKEDGKYTYTLYWYADHDVILNRDLAFMFDRFTRLRYVDLSGFVYLDGVDDTRYMFSECRKLKTVRFKTSNQKLNMTRFIRLNAVQGMFYSCQSLQSVDFFPFDTSSVTNMDDMFYKCYNLQRILANPDRWNTENVLTYNRMFSECHSLLTNKGKKAVDINDDDYGAYAQIGTDSKEGLITDYDYSYNNFSDDISNVTQVPIDSNEYVVFSSEGTTKVVDEEGTEWIYSSREVQGPGKFITQSSTTKETDERDYIESIKNNIVSAESELEEESSKSEEGETANTIVEASSEIKDSIGTSNDNEQISTKDRKVIELDEYLSEKTTDDKGSKEEGFRINISDDTLILVLIVLSGIIILLVGMILYLYKDKKDDKG